jgi:hypothetical protein
MAWRTDIYGSPPARLRRKAADRPSPPARVLLGIATAVLGAHIAFWLVGLIE